MSMSSPDVLSFAAIDHRLRKGAVFGVRPADLLRHVYVIGKTGAGKTALLERLAAAEIRAGRGCAMLDPHGDLAERLLDLVPRWRVNDVVVFEPWDLDMPVGLNVLEAVPCDQRALVASGVLAIFRKVFSEFWGPRLEHLFRHALLALLEVQGSTLLGVPRLLLEERFRAGVVHRIEDPMVRLFWTREFPSWPPAFRAEAMSPVLNKVGAVLASPLLRNIVGQTRTAFSARALMDEGRVLVASLAKGRIGEEASALLGAVLVTRFQLAAYSRATTPVGSRRPFTLYVDEFASFATRSFAELLAEARKYSLALVLAHQHLGQIDEDLHRAVMGNAGTLIAFRLGGEDAETLGREFGPEFTPGDLTRLGCHQIALRLAVDGMTSLPFTAVTLPPHPEHEYEGHAPVIRRVSRERYGRPREKVEREIAGQLGAGA